MSTEDTIRLAIDTADAGWWVLPVADGGKHPILPKDFWTSARPPVAPWAEEHLIEEEGQWSIAKSGFYWASRDHGFLTDLITHLARGGEPFRLGVTSAATCADIDHRGRVPAEHLEHALTLPGCDTPGGGRHVFWREIDGMEALKVGTFFDGQGEPIGEIRHRTKSFTKLYDGLPPLAEVEAATPCADFLTWILNARQRSGNKAAPRREKCGVSVEEDPGHDPEPLVLAEMTPDSGCHDYLLDGTMADARAGRDRVRLWARALTMGPGRDKSTAASEAANAYQGAREKVGRRMFGGGARDASEDPAPEEPKVEAPVERRAFDPDSFVEFGEAAGAAGIEIVRVDPSGHVGVFLPGDDEPQEWRLNNKADSLAMVAMSALRSMKGGPFLVKSNCLRRAFFVAAAEENPRVFAHLVDEGRDRLESAVSSCPGTTTVEQILECSRVLDKYESGAKSPDMERLARKILREKGWRGDGTRRGYWCWFTPSKRKPRKALFGAAEEPPADAPDPGWRQETGRRSSRVWSPPEGWSVAADGEESA